MGRTVLASKIIEHKGLDRISMVVHDMNCLWRPTSCDDYGIDGEIEYTIPKVDGKGSITEGGIIKVQSKSGESYVVQDSDTAFSTPVEKEQLEYWHNCNFPVILIVYHLKDDKLYWKEIKSYVRNTPNIFKPPLKVIFNKATDVFDETCRDRLGKIALISPPRVSIDQQEKLFSNLLLVKTRPRTIYFAPTEHKTRDDIKMLVQGYTPPFDVQSGVLYSLDDMRKEDSILRPYCDADNTDHMPADEWIDDDERGYIYLLNQLLRSHLYRSGLRFNRDYKRYYFPKYEDSDSPVKRRWHNLRTSNAAPERTIAKFYVYGKDRFWRHMAVQTKFLHISDRWFLMIIPRYFLTYDGTIPYDSERVGSLTTKVKSRERNLHVLNHLFFLIDVISHGKPEIILRMNHRKMMIIDKMPMSTVADFAIPDDPAIFEEEDAPHPNFADTLFEEEGIDEEEEEE